MKIRLFLLFAIPLLIVFCNIFLSISNPVPDALIQENILLTLTSTKDILELELNDYIKGVVYAEMPASFNIEALKAQAVAARTYTKSKLIAGLTLCDDPAHCQAWKKPDDTDAYKKISLAVDLTGNEILTYSNEPIQACFHSSSGGQTESAKNVWGKEIPYLISVSSPNEEEITPLYREQKEFTFAEFQKLINNYEGNKIITSENLKIKILSRTESGRVKEIKINNIVFFGAKIRNIFNLRSTFFYVEIHNKNIIFTTVGYGHGVGLSQWGAEAMALNGSSYKEILAHYYPDTILQTQ